VSDSIFSELSSPEPTPLDYVRKLETRLAREKEGGEPTLSRQLCQVAHDVIRDAKEAGRLPLEQWKHLNNRVRALEEWLIENDRW